MESAGLTQAPYTPPSALATVRAQMLSFPTPMSMLTRFFGKREAGDTDPGLLVANAAIKDPLTLQILFPGVWRVDPVTVAAALQVYAPGMAGAQCELEPTLAAQGKIIGLLGWRKHVIRFMGFDLPLPAATVEACVAPAHYSPEIKTRARSHQSHLLLFYTGEEPSLLNQYVSLAAVAGALAPLGALVVLNEAARTSFQAAALARPNSDRDTDMLELLRELPLPALYVGFVKYNMPNVPGVWMRTFGAPRLKLPDLAAHAAGHHESERYFGLFNHLLRYMLTSGTRPMNGQTVPVAGNTSLRLRPPGPQEPFVENNGDLLVAEFIEPE